MKFIRDGCAHRGSVLNPVCMTDAGLWAHSSCSNEQACCDFFPSSSELSGAQNPARLTDKEGSSGTQITKYPCLQLLRCTPLSTALHPQWALELELVTPTCQPQCCLTGTHIKGSTQIDTLRQSGNLTWDSNLLSRVITCLRAGSVLASRSGGPGTDLSKCYQASQGTARLVHRRPEQGQFLITLQAVTDLLIAASMLPVSNKRFRGLLGSHNDLTY